MKRYIISIVVLITLVIGGFFTYSYLMKGGAPVPTTPIVDQSKASSTSYTLEDVSAHNSASDCWTAVNNNVYDLTAFIPSHPGGTAIIPACGNDGTSLFKSIRDHVRENAQVTLDVYFIGRIK